MFLANSGAAARRRGRRARLIQQPAGRGRMTALRRMTIEILRGHCRSAGARLGRAGCRPEQRRPGRCHRRAAAIGRNRSARRSCATSTCRARSPGRPNGRQTHRPRPATPRPGGASGAAKRVRRSRPGHRISASDKAGRISDAGTTARTGDARNRPLDLERWSRRRFRSRSRPIRRRSPALDVGSRDRRRRSAPTDASVPGPGSPR